MTARKTWVWIVVGVLVSAVVVLIGVAGAGVYFVTRHIKTERVTSVEAIRAFDSARALFSDRGPLYEIDEGESPRLTRPFSELPSSDIKPESVWVLAWDPNEERLVKVSLPFWMLQFGRQKMAFANSGRRFDMERLHLDGAELERIGPALVFDYRDRDGTRVLLWTQ